MRVLVVEDSPDKMRRVCRCLTSVRDVTMRNIETCVDAAEARRRLQRHKYDLLVIDVAIPSQPDMEPSGDVGVALLEDIEAVNGCIVPDHVIVLTAYDDLHSLAAVKVSSKSWAVVKYRLESEDWALVLRDTAGHIREALEGREAADEDYGCDLAVMCALDTPELDSVRGNGWEWSMKAVPKDHGIYYSAEYECHGEKHTAVACAAPRVGMTAAAITAMKLIHLFRPRYLVMAGIAAGIRGRVNLGDIIVVETAFDYGSGKFDHASGKSRFLVDPHHLQLAPELRSKARLFSDDEGWLGGLHRNWAGPKPDTEIRIRLGPLATGAAVLADKRVTDRVMAQHRKLLGIDMEAYAVLAAALEASEPKPTALVIKSVCDFADEEKDDATQKYAAYTSARMVVKFAEEWL